MADYNNNNRHNAIPELETLKNRCNALEKNGDDSKQEQEKIKQTLAQIGRILIWMVEQPSVSQQQCDKKYQEILKEQEQYKKDMEKIAKNNKWSFKSITAIAPLWLMVIAILIKLFM